MHINCTCDICVCCERRENEMKIPFLKTSKKRKYRAKKEESNNARAYHSGTNSLEKIRRKRSLKQKQFAKIK